MKHVLLLALSFCAALVLSHVIPQLAWPILSIGGFVITLFAFAWLGIFILGQKVLA